MSSISSINWNSVANSLPTLFVIAAIVIILDVISNPQKNNQVVIPKLIIKRKDFSNKTKKSVLFRQGYRCNSCLKPLEGIQDFHHKNGNRSNNTSWNCEALCPNCHARKTRQA